MASEITDTRSAIFTDSTVRIVLSSTAVSAKNR